MDTGKLKEQGIKGETSTKLTEVLKGMKGPMGNIRTKVK